MEKSTVKPSIPGYNIHIELMDNGIGGTGTLHFHNEYELLWVDKFCVDYYINGKKIVMEPGDTMFVNASVPHYTDVPNGTDARLLLFDTNAGYDSNAVFNHIARLGLHNNTDYFLFKKNSKYGSAVSWLINSVCNEYDAKEKSFVSFITAFVDNITAILYRENILTDPNEYYDMKNMNRLMPVLEYIENHYSEHVSLTDVCQLINLSEFHFCKLFKKYMKIPFLQYLNFVRICYAEVLLQKSEKSVSEIAYETGFSSPAHFSSMFKKQKVMSPTEYRKYLAG